MVIIFLLLLLPTSASCAAGGESIGRLLDSLVVPERFEISLFAAAVPGARSLAVAPNGTVFVGSRKEGKVYALPDFDNNGIADTTYIIGESLYLPNGVAFRDGSLYVAEVTRILVYDSILDRLGDPPEPMVVYGDLPEGSNHGWKFIAFGPDGKLYVSVGAPCNVCEIGEDEGEQFATILRMNRNGSGMELFARGVRNTVGFDWNPETGILWFTDNGRDWLGDDSPPDELNRAPEAQMHFGFPYCHGGSIPDPEFAGNRHCDEFEPPAVALQPHAAALGMRFYDGGQFPDEYTGGIFIAEHGSWNRREPVGYRIEFVPVISGVAGGPEVFAHGWLGPDGTVHGRPVDVEVAPDGALLVSDDLRGVIYRIHHLPEEGKH